MLNTSMFKECMVISCRTKKDSVEDVMEEYFEKSVMKSVTPS